MKLDLRQLLINPGGELPFSFDLDLSDLDFYGAHPFAEPIAVSGLVSNHAGMLVMQASAETTLHVNCDRCGKPFLRPAEYPFSHMLADHLEDEENDEILVYEGNLLNLGEIAKDDLIFGMDSRNLCKEDCLGRCFRCGQYLNEGPCSCKPEVDSRMAVLAKLLERRE